MEKENKRRLFQGEEVRILQQGTKNAHVRRVRDGKKFSVPIKDLEIMPESWTPPPPPEEKVAVPEVQVETPPPEDKPLDPRSVRRKLLHLQLEPHHTTAKEKRGPIPVRLFGRK